MREHRLKLPELALIAVTRGMLGLGAGLLVAAHLSPRHRRITGAALVAAGVLSTIPIAWRLFRRRQPAAEAPVTVDSYGFSEVPPIVIAEILTD